MRVLVVLIQRHVPRDLLRSRVDLHRPAQVAYRGQHLPGDRADGPVRSERDPVGPAIAVLHHCFVQPQVKDHDQ